MPEALIVDDEPGTMDALADLVRREGFSTRTAATLDEARQELARRLPDLVLCDLVLPDGHGTELLRVVADEADVETVMVTANASVSSAVDALRLGAYDYLIKPVDVDRLRAILRRLRERVSLRREVATLRRELRRHGRFGELVGASHDMERVYDLIERVAPTAATVLVIGESGTGKEVVAETIHRLSRRGDGPFVPLNCGAVSPQLIESELFGHEKGSFTGADRRHRGVFERAHQGTLFLDEITEMSAELQVRLLRVLETGTVRRVGGQREIEVDVRVVAATNRDPDEAVRDGRLRKDLYYRLKVFPIPLPPLRDRAGDVAPLAQHFLDRLCRAGETVKDLDPETLERLEAYPWPGNVRELRNVVERAFILADDRITVDCLPAEIRGDLHPEGARLQAPLGTPLEEVVRSHTLATLEHFGGNKKQTADALGVSLKTLYNRLNRYREEDGTP